MPSERSERGAESKDARAGVPPPPDRRLDAFVAIFAAYLLIRGYAYEPALGLLALFLVPPWTRRVAAALAVVVEAGIIREHVYLLSNHGFLETWILAAIAAAPARTPAGREALARALRVAFVIFLLWAGVQKLLHGYYLPGDYFTVEAARPGKLGKGLLRLVPEEGRAAVVEYHRDVWRFAREGAPGLFERPPPDLGAVPLVSALFCWTTLLVEIGAPLLLLRGGARLRWAAIGALAVFIVCVEALADEWHFAMLFGAMLALWVPGTVASEEGRKEGSQEGFLHSSLPAFLRGNPALAALLALLALWPAAHFVLTRTHDLNPWKLAGFAMYAAPERWDANRIEVRLPGDEAWRPYDPGAPGAPGRLIQVKGWALRNAGDLPTGAAREIAALVRAHRPEVAAVRVRVRVLDHDRTTNRFRLRERVYASDP